MRTITYLNKIKKIIIRNKIHYFLQDFEKNILKPKAYILYV